MGCIQDHALGRSVRFYISEEATCGTFEKPVGADAAKVMSTEFTLNQERKVRADNRQSRSQLERITGKATVDWSVEGYVIPSGTAGTPPDMHQLFYGAMGGYTNTPSTSDVYSLVNDQDMRTHTLVREMNSVFMETIWGAWVNEMSISASGGDEPKVSFSGQAMGYCHTGTSTLNGQMSASTTMVVETADKWSFSTNSVVKIGSTTDVTVTVDTSRPSFTVDTSVSEADEAVVIPYVPTETTAGSPINGISGSLTYDGTEFPVTAFDLTVTNNAKGLDDEAMQQYPDDVIPGYRDVTGTFSTRVRKDLVALWGQRMDFTIAPTLTVVLGSTAGSIVTLTMTNVELDFASVDVPEAEEAVFSIPFRALASSSGDDELTITFT